MAYTLAPEPEQIVRHLAADGAFPNNPALPLVVYRAAVRADDADPAAAFEQLFQANGWGGCWVNGIYGFQHFHSNAHEVLGVCDGSAQVQFGGPNGEAFSLAAGDVAILPAGTAHTKLSASAGFRVVGAYPAGQEDYDLLRGEPGERERAERNIAAVAIPSADPVYGADGPLRVHWR